MLELRDIQITRHGRTILNIQQLQIAPAHITVILGHNGSGKSTLMNLLANQNVPDQGVVSLQGMPLKKWRLQDFAREVAYLPQQLRAVPGLTVTELVQLGRFPWRGMLGRWQDRDLAIVQQAMARTGVTYLADHLTENLSGGERQRAWIAMLLAQQSPLLLLDEPTSALDLSHQYELLNLLKQINRQENKGIVLILHDLNLALRFADRILVLRQGSIRFDGSPSSLMCEHTLSDLFDIPIKLVPRPASDEQVAIVA